MTNTIAYLLVIGVPMAAWLTHVFHCFSEGSWGFLLVGAIVPPIGMLHGLWLWF